MRHFLSDIPRPVLLLTGVSFLLAVILLFDLIPFLRGGFGWQWPYNPVEPGRTLPLVLLIAVYIAGGWGLLRRPRLHRAVLLGWAALGATLIPLAVMGLRHDDMGYELFARTVSGVTTGTHMAGAEIDWGADAWRDWPAMMDSYQGRSGHIALSPPGLPLWYGLLNALFESAPGLSDSLQHSLLPYQCNNFSLLAYTPGEWASAWFGMLMPLWSALAVLPLYALARRFAGERWRGVVLWWALIPALVMFVPTWNTIYPLLSLIAFWLLLRGLSGGWGWLVAAGLASGFLLFANFSLVPLVGFFGLYTLLDYFLNERRSESPPPHHRPVVAGIGFGIGLVIPWLIFWLLTGSSPFDLLQTALKGHFVLERPYLPWLWLHSWDWALFAGIPLVALWMIVTVRRLRSWWEPGPVLGVALLLTLVVLVVGNLARGETGRVWLFFTPFTLIVAAQIAEMHSPQHDSAGNRTWLLITLAQAAILLALVSTWDVINAPEIRPPPEAPTAAARATRPIAANFDDRFQLISWDATGDAENISLILDWQASQQMTIPYWFAAILVAPDGTSPVEAFVWQPFETQYPTPCWTPDDLLGETVVLPLPEEAITGDWWISLMAFPDVDAPDNRLAIQLADGSVDAQIGLGPVAVARER